MRSEKLDDIFRRDLDRLPGLADDELVPARRPSRRVTVGTIAVLSVLAICLVVVGVSFQAARESLLREQAATTSSTLGNQSASATPSASPASASTAAAAFALCPLGQIPVVDASLPPPPGDQPGRGAANAEAAFRAAHPTLTQFTMTPMGSGPTAPVWIVAGGETYVALLFGTPEGNNWFVYPAKAVRCGVP